MWAWCWLPTVSVDWWRRYLITAAGCWPKTQAGERESFDCLGDLLIWSWSLWEPASNQSCQSRMIHMHLHNHSYARSQLGSITYGINWSRIPSFGSPNPAWELFPIVSGHTYCVAKFRLHSTVQNITIQYSIVTLHRINCKFHEVRYHSFSIGGPGLWSMKLCDTFMILHESWLWSRVLGRGECMGLYF